MSWLMTATGTSPLEASPWVQCLAQFASMALWIMGIDRGPSSNVGINFISVSKFKGGTGNYIVVVCLDAWNLSYVTDSELMSFVLFDKNIGLNSMNNSMCQA